MPHPACFHLDRVPFVRGVLQPGFAFLDSDHTAVRQQARLIPGVPDDRCEVVPGVHPSHFEVGIGGCASPSRFLFSASHRDLPSNRPPGTSNQHSAGFTFPNVGMGARLERSPADRTGGGGNVVVAGCISEPPIVGAGEPTQLPHNLSSADVHSAGGVQEALLRPELVLAGIQPQPKQCPVQSSPDGDRVRQLTIEADPLRRHFTPAHETVERI